MARIIDYRFDEVDFVSTGDSTKIANRGDDGASYDAVMYTGQGLDLDGGDEYVDTGVVVPAEAKTLYCVVDLQKNPDDGGVFGGYSGSNEKAFVLGRYQDAMYMRVGTDYTVSAFDGSVTTGVFHMCLTRDDSIFRGYLNGAKSSDYSYTSMTGGDNYWIGALDYTGWETACVVYLAFALGVTVTDDDIAYLANNPEAVVRMFVTDTVDSSLSFGPTDILHMWTLDEGGGLSVYELKNGTEGTIVNGRTDGTNWTNGDESSVWHQMSRYKKDSHHNPSTPADHHTIRFD